MNDENLKVEFGEFETVYSGKIFNVKQREVTYPDGTVKTHEYCERFDSVTVLAFDEQDNLLLTREFREGKNKYVWFLPCGKIDPGETAEQAVQREMREEVGKRAKTLKLLFKRPASSNYFLWDTYVYVAKDLIEDPLEAEEYFPIEVVPTPLDKAMEMALSGEISNLFLAYNILRFDYLKKHGEFKW
ncbi:MAG: NUDIX hydrolase [bacterium]